MRVNMYVLMDVRMHAFLFLTAPTQGIERLASFVFRHPYLPVHRLLPATIRNTFRGLQKRSYGQAKSINLQQIPESAVNICPVNVVVLCMG